MSVLRQYMRNLNLDLSPVFVGELVIILAIVIFAIYVFYSLNLFRKER